MPENPANPIPVFGELNSTVREERGWETHTCRWVNYANNDYPKKVYSISGQVESVTNNIDTIVEERGYESSSIDITDDYSSTMRSDLFRDVSEEWQGEAGYDRNELNCVPNDQHFDATGMACD